MNDPEIKRVVGKEKFDSLSETERLREIFRFNDNMQKMQAKLPGGNPGIPKGVYRFKNQEDADAQVNFYIMRAALKR